MGSKSINDLIRESKRLRRELKKTPIKKVTKIQGVIGTWKEKYEQCLRIISGTGIMGCVAGVMFIVFGCFAFGNDNTIGWLNVLLGMVQLIYSGIHYVKAGIKMEELKNV